jgi:hypothetical protein
MAEIINKSYRFEEIRVDMKKSVQIQGNWVDMGPATFEGWVIDNDQELDYTLRERKYTRHIDLMRHAC